MGCSHSLFLAFHPTAPRISVVGPRYCNRKKKVVALVPLANGDIAVANDKRRINFKAEELHRDLGRDPWRLRDAAGNPIVTLIPKFLTTHGRWEVFKGDSQNWRDLIFTAKKHSIVNLQTNLNVFLAKNTAEKVPDFKVEGSFSVKSYTIYAGEVIIAQSFANPFPVVGPQYCAPSNREIVLVFLMLENGDVVVADVNGSIKFIVKEVHRTLAPNLRIIHDVAGKPIVTMKPKVLTAHSRWEFFRGDSKDFQNLIFTAKTHSMVNLKTKLDVFLANNTAEKVPDFKVKGSFLKQSCTIFAGDQAPIIIAEKKNEQNVDNIFLGGDKFMATAYPNVDYAFIVSLIVILGAINRKSVYTGTMESTVNSIVEVAGDLEF